MKRSLQDRLKSQEEKIARLKFTYSASDLVRAIESKHALDVVVTECKDGPTHTAQHRRLDVWVMLRTWSPIRMIGYEVKVSRSDWLRDTKLIAYLPLCHYLYVVAPPGIVQHEELPAGVGLLEPIGDGTRLITRRKAIWRDIELPGELLVYVLMCRAKITREYRDHNDWRVQTLREWVETKSEKKTLSHAVSAKIRETFAEQERRQSQLNYRLERLERIEKRLIELGFDPDKPVDLWDVNQRLKPALDPAAIDSAIATMRNAIEQMNLACRQLKLP